MEDTEGREAEEDEDNVGGEFDAFLPFLPQNPRQCQYQRLCQKYGNKNNCT